MTQSRKIYILPNFVTTLNLFCGFASMIYTMQGSLIASAWWIFAAGICDMLDGRIARFARATSPFGVEYDSLSDVVSFGLAPALLMFQAGLDQFGRLGWFVAFAYAACGALRLARFNVTLDTVPKGYFQGLPIPMAAGFLISYLIFDRSLDEPIGDFRPYFLLISTAGMAALMVSKVLFPTFKEFNWRSRASFPFVMLGFVTLALIIIKAEVMLFVVGAVYVGTCLLWNLRRLLLGRTT